MADYSLGTAHGQITIDADTKGVDQANQAMGNLGKGSQTTSQAVQTVGTSMGVAGLAIAGGLGLAVKSASDFGAQLSGIAAVGGKDAADKMTEIHDKALEIGKATTFSASEAAAAMSELVKAGIPVTDVLGGAADATVALAAATGVDMPTAAQIASNAMNVFGIKAEDMDGVVDTLAKTANASAIDVTDLGMSMQQVGAVANLAGLSLEDTTTAIGEMGDAGIKGSDAGTSLKTMLMNLQPSTKKQTDLFRELGIITEDGSNKFYDQEGHLKSLRDIQGILGDSLKGMTDAQKQAALETMFGSDAIRAAAVMADGGAAGYDRFAKKLTEQSSAAEQAKIRQDNMKGSMEQLMGSLENTGIVIGEVLIPPLRELLGWVQSAFDWFGQLPGPVQTVATYALAAAAAFLLLGSGIIKIVGFATKMSGAVSTIIGALTRQTAAAGTTAAANEAGAARTAAAWIATQAKMVAGWIASQAQTVALWAMYAAEAVANAAKVAAAWVANSAKAVASFVAMSASAVAEGAKTAAAWVAAQAKTVAQWVLMAAGAAANAAKVALAWVITNGTAVATSLASLAVAVATTIAGWITMAVTAMINAAIVAAAWLIAFWPVVLIIAIIAAVIIAVVVFWDEIVAAFKAGAQWIGDAMNAAWQWIQQAWDWILQKFQEAWDWIVSIFQGILDAVTTAWDSIVNAFKQAGQWVLDALNQTWAWIKGVWDSILAFFRAIPGWIKDVFTGAINWLLNFGMDILNGLWNGIKNVWNAVTGWFAQVGGWVKSAFSGALNWLLDAGKSIIQGLWNGIVSVKDWILDKISGFIGSIIGGIKSFFGIASPSKVMHEVGMNVGQGLALGIRDSLQQVDAAFGDMVKLGEVSNEQWDALVAAGWKGRPGDGMEALYRPTTPNARVAAGSVSQGQWDALMAAGYRGDPSDGMEALYPPDYFKGMESALTTAAYAVSDATSQLGTVLTSTAMSAGGPEAFWDGTALGGARVPTSNEVSSYAASQDEPDRVVNINTNIYNPVIEDASDSEARRLRTLSALGAF